MNKALFIVLSLLVAAHLEAKTIRIMPLGDSITQGYTFAYKPIQLRAAYRQSLWYRLKNAKYDVDFVGSQIAGNALVPRFDYHHEGYPGYTTYNIANMVYGLLSKNTPDIILLHIGTNDWGTSITGVTKILDAIDRFEKNNNHHITVILARIINSSIYESWITTYNKNLQTMANKRIAKGDDIVVVDMEHGAKLNYSTDFDDYLHPNANGYNKMAAVWFNALEKVIARINDTSWLIPIISVIL